MQDVTVMLTHGLRYGATVNLPWALGSVTRSNHANRPELIVRVDEAAML